MVVAYRIILPENLTTVKNARHSFQGHALHQDAIEVIVTEHSSFVHLHVHTEYSLLDGAIRIKELFRKARDLGMEAVAVTDHGNMFGAVQFFTEAKKAGIKPLLGCEVYVAPGARTERSPSPGGSLSAYHLILLVQNEEGYRNLSRLVTLGHTEGFYYHPRVDMDLLREYNGGLIALSACLKGIIPHRILSGRIEEAKQKAEEFSRIFSGDRFFFEVQANRLSEQIKVNAVLKELSRELSIPLVGTNDCHYLNREDAEAHDALLCIQTGKSIDDPKRLKFSSDEFFFKSRDEMASALGDPALEEALDNTVHVARLCDFEMEFGRYKYPVFTVAENTSLEEILASEARRGLEKRLSQKKEESGSLSPEALEEYRDRLEFELNIINSMGFAGYFLIVADFIDHARRSDIPVGPGRGSAAGSLVAYCLKITNIDPIKYGLLFERFLNPQRISMPDIDIDFCINGRDDVIRYVSEKYGRENVAQIITFGTMKARAVIRDVGRTLSIPYGEVDRIAKLVPAGPNVSLDRALEEEPELRKLKEGEEHQRKLLNIALSLEGLSRHASTHASGVVISDRPLVEYLPLFKGPNDEIMTQFTMDQIEKLGLIKFDFLGLKTLTVIKQALALIEKRTGRSLDIETIPLDDEATYRLCSEGKTTGVFQLESAGMKELLRNLKPEVFEDMVALVALYRPGPLGSNMVDEFIAGKHGKARIKYMLPQLEPILKETYGVILYQEQVMKIGQILAKYTLAEADELRKAIGKKKPEVMARHRARFTEGAAQNGVKPKMADRLFALIDKFGGYGFNKSHSAAYALIAYQTAYLKAHYPVEFMAALLTQDMGNQDKTIKNIAECREMGIAILPPDINESQSDFAVVEGGIRFGLGAVKNVGLKAVEAVIEERDQGGPFKDLLDFCRRVDGSRVNRRVLEGLIQCGAFDFARMARSRLFAAVDDMIRFCHACQDSNQLSIFASLEEDPAGGGLFDILDLPEWEEREKLRREKEALGFYITGHPLDRYRIEVEHFTSCTIEDLPNVKDKITVKVAGIIENLKIKRTKRGDKMALCSLEDSSGSVEIVIFPDVFNNCSPLLKGDEPLLVSGTAEVDDSTVKVIAQEITSLDRVKQESIRSIELALPGGPLSRENLEDLKDIIFRYPGESSVLFKLEACEGRNYIIAAHDRYRVSPCEEMIHEVEAIIGGKVTCRYGKKNSNPGYPERP
ncbi:MAG: DNA polymerase III subunit alpha [Deltaproteobacteria bacterium]|nr:DNA polymerase III subunit alpha [Deltaproteobacteria bacterium]